MEMASRWQRVDSIDGYERTYRRDVYRVAYRPLEPGARYLHRDLFIDGERERVALPPVDVPEKLDDPFYENSLRSVKWFISQWKTKSGDSSL